MLEIVERYIGNVRPMKTLDSEVDPEMLGIKPGEKWFFVISGETRPPGEKFLIQRVADKWEVYNFYFMLIFFR